MTYKAKLDYELGLMREIYPMANELKDNLVIGQIMERVDEIKVLLSNLCYECKEEPRRYNQYYCSEKCQDKYYAGTRERHVNKDISYMQQRLREMGKASKIA